MIEALKKRIGGEILENEPLANHCTFRIGGKAKYFFIAKNEEEIKKAVLSAKELELPFFIFGGGSNVLFPDEVFDGLVIKIKDESMEVENNKIYVGAGTILGKLVNFAAEKGLSGLEWAAGIPGTVGGAVRGNAGAYGHAIGEVVESVETLEITNPAPAKLRRGKQESQIPPPQSYGEASRNYGREECGFKYRESIFKKNKDIILKVCLVLEEGNGEKIKEEMDNILKMRNEKLPLDYPSAGCVFKNLEIDEEILNNLKNKEIPQKFVELGKIPAAWFIEQCGLKGKQIGGARISEKHANFIVNIGGATAKEVVELIELIKTEVNRKFGVQIEEEIELVLGMDIF